MTAIHWRRRACVLALTGVSAAGVLAFGAWGPLDPPSGAIAPTGPTMIFSIPYTISTPGSYIVARDLVGPGTGSQGITISASQVTLDLGGFRLLGSSSSPDGRHAVNITGSQVTVRNGLITAWTGSGVNVGGTGCRVEHITFQGCYSTSDNNTGAAIAGAGVGTTVIGCTSLGNCERGFILGTDANVLDCTVEATKNVLIVGDRSLVSRCTANHVGSPVTGTALVTGLRCTVQGCTVNQESSGLAVSVGEGSSLLDSTVRAPTAGVSSGPGCILSRVNVSGPIGTGIAVGDNTTVSDCLYSRSGGAAGTGMSVGNGVTLTSCTVSGASTGILVTGSGCRVEANRVTGGAGQIGIQVAGTNNFIARNAVRSPGGTEYSIAASNSFGPLVTVTGVGDISGTGNANHPWANFRY